MGEDEEVVPAAVAADESQPEDVAPSESEPIESQESEETQSWEEQLFLEIHNLNLQMAEQSKALTNLLNKLIPSNQPEESEPETPVEPTPPTPPQPMRPNRKRKLF